MGKTRRKSQVHDDILYRTITKIESFLYEVGSVGHTIGSVGMGRALISVALSAPSPAAFSPHETVSLTIQLIYPEELTRLFQHRHAHSHHKGHPPCSVFVAVDREASGIEFVTIRVCERQATRSLLKSACVVKALGLETLY